MTLKFEKVILHNFLSYGHAEIDLSGRSYCQVKGINRCPKDNAASNGAGKSSLISAICWALTGQTIQGISKDIKNIYVSENSCYVTLIFKVDDDEYEITRFKEPSSNLRIILNGEDKSGKGIKESELILGNYLPDLTMNLIGSVILIGQGMPNKFTSNTPSGRKEVLESLSKSDYMISDIKSRIETRQQILSEQFRQKENELISISSKLSIYNTQLEASRTNLAEAMKPVNFDEEISQLETLYKADKTEYDNAKGELDNIEKEVETINGSLLTATTKKQELIEAANKEYNKVSGEYQEQINNLTVEKGALEAEITRVKNIKDVCPTCGRPFEGVVKPDISKQEERVEEIKRLLTTLNEDKAKVYENYKGVLNSIETSHTESVSGFNQRLTELRESKGKVNTTLSTKNTDYLNHKGAYDKKVAEKENYINNLNKLKGTVAELEKTVGELTESQKNELEVKNNIQKHLDVVKKMSTLASRDFRGHLLSNVIEYINNRSKKYSKTVFNTDEFDFSLNGNNLDISYCGKPLESLSGGEQQKANIIIQFAIRDMLKQFLGFNSNILCLDEIFDNLDSLSTTSILNLISEELTDIESIFIISHHDDLEIPYDSELIIEKGADGISKVM